MLVEEDKNILLYNIYRRIKLMEKEEQRKLTNEELDQIDGGFSFDSFYFIHKRELNIKCPICGAEGTLDSVGTGWEGYAGGTRVAVDNSICSNCGTQVDIQPELGRLVVSNFNPDTFEYKEEVFPFEW